MFIPPFQAGNIVTNEEIMKNFHCACEGGIRPANATDSIVLVLNHTRMNHKTDWHGDILWFRGSGSSGDQKLDKGRNRTLLEAFRRGRPVYLFEVYKAKAYTFRGEVKLAGEPFQKDTEAENGWTRKVWIFPLKLAHE